jgi:hypothetical protein
VGFEILQEPWIIAGTFSLPDLVFGISGMLLGFIIGSIKTKTKNHEKAF